MRITANLVDIFQQRVYAAVLETTEPIDNTPARISCIVDRGAEDPQLPYLLPGFVDAHIHIESTLLTPAHFAPVAAQHGVTSVFADPHEIANVLGTKGVDYMLENAAGVHYNFHFAASPCVPSTTFEHSGATLNAADIKAMLQRKEIYGLGEMMNIPGLIYEDPEVLAKLAAARAAGKPIDGHMPGISKEWAERCSSAGINSDHETMTIEEARMKLRHGIRILIREGSAARNYDALAPLLADETLTDQLMFCSDDKYADELIAGYIDDLVRESVKRGYPLWNVLRAACVNPVLHFGTDDGLLREGDKADFILVDNLHKFTILEAYVGGSKAGSPTLSTTASSQHNPNNFLAQAINPADLRLEAKGDTLRVMQLHDGQLWTDALERKARVVEGAAVSDTATDTLKIVVLNRYAPKDKPAIGFITGFGILQGAMGCSIGHDSHNLVAVGTTDEAICEVINKLVEMRGGMVIRGEHDMETLPLPVAGLMSDQEATTVAEGYQRILQAAEQTGCPLQAPFMTLAFMTLPVIPQLKITDMGLFDVEKFGFSEPFKR